MKWTVMGLVWLLVAMPVAGQHAVSGVVAGTQGEALQGANIVLMPVNRGGVTGPDGSFRLEDVPSGTYTLRVSFVGYEPVSKDIRISGDTELETITLTRSTMEMEEVMVTATRAGEKTPVTFTSVTREEISTRNFGQDVPFLLTGSPSVVTTSDAGHGIGYTSMRIRGTDANRINVTVNGIPLNDAESHGVFWVDLPDIATSVDNIQIQRGVGTSTNGAAAFGASVNIQTRKLEKEPYAVYDGTAGSFRTFRNALSAGTGLIGDHFAVDIRLSDIRSDGYMDRSWTDLQSYYVSAGYFDSRTMVKFIHFSGQEELYQAWGGVPSDLLETDRTYNGLGEYTDAGGRTRYYDNQIDHYRQDHYQLHLSRQLAGKWYVNSALHYTRGAGYYEEYRESEPLAAYLLEPVVTGADTIRESDLIRRKWLDNHFYGFVGGLHYTGDKLSAVLGGGLNRYDGDHYGHVIWARYPGDSEIRHRWYESTGVKDDWNGYVKASYDAGERVALFADLQLRGIGYRIDGIDDDLRDLTQRHDYLFFNPKAGLHIETGPGQRAYLSVARANREPNRSNFTDADPAGPQPVKESLVDVEAGYAYRTSGLRAEANVYYMDYTDQLVLTGEINDVGSPIMTNVKDSYRTGIELSLGISPFSWLSWDVNATLSSNKIPDYTGYVDNWDFWSDPENEPYQVVEELGVTDLAFSPALVANSRVTAEPLDRLNIYLVSRYVGKQYIDNTSSEERILQPYFVNNLNISYGFSLPVVKELELQLQVVNLLNVEYETNAWIYRYYLGGEEAYLDGYYPQAGRHLMAGLRLRF